LRFNFFFKLNSQKKYKHIYLDLLQIVNKNLTSEVNDVHILQKNLLTS